MRNMSFSLTTDSFRNRKKDVTRRLGWRTLLPGDHVMAVEQAQGLKKGEKIKKLGEIIILAVDEEPVKEIIVRPYRGDMTRTEMEREGFPSWTASQFVQFFCRVNKCERETIIRRVEFKHA